MRDFLHVRYLFMNISMLLMTATLTAFAVDGPLGKTTNYTQCVLCWLVQKFALIIATAAVAQAVYSGEPTPDFRIANAYNLRLRNQ